MVNVAAGCTPRVGVMEVMRGGEYVVYAAHNNLAVVCIKTMETTLFPAPSPITTVKCNEEFTFVGCLDGEYIIFKCNGTSEFKSVKSGKLSSLVAYSSASMSGFIVGCTDGSVYFVPTSSPGDHSILSIPPPKRITCIGFMSKFNLLIVALSDLTLCIYNLDFSGEPRVLYLLSLADHHVNWINHIDILEDRFLTCGQDKNCRVWSVKPKASGISGSLVSELVTVNNTIQIDNQEYSIDTEALLVGHEDLVWSGKFISHDYIVTCSADRTVIKWQEGEEAWQSVLQVGDVSGIGVAGNGDLYDVAVIGETIIAHNTNGTIVSWQEPALQPIVLVSGHFSEVTDICFDRHHGDYLLSCSLDRTTRAWFPQDQKLIELARPQVHGYEIKSIDIINDTQFVSAADEKVLRVFDMTESFSQSLGVLGGTARDPSKCKSGVVMQPALGLSNKSSEGNRNSIHYTIPSETELSSTTLWPETDKLYGHGDELQCVAASPDGQWIASASRVTLAGDSAIRIWSSSTHSLFFTLKPHNLTVVRLCFSPSSAWLLSCSRDRKLAVCGVREGKIVALVEEAHERIIWDGAWIDEATFITCSRDKTVKVWQFNNQKVRLVRTIPFEDAVTAVCSINQHQFAVGLESGSIIISSDDTRTLVHTVNGRVNRLAYSRNRLAIASADHAVTIITI